MGWVGIAALALGAVQQGLSQKAAGDAEASLQKMNAKIAGYQADNAIFQGEQDVTQIRQTVRSIIGAQRAGAAGNGLNVNEGTPLELQMDSARLGELDVARARYNARLAAWASKVGQSSALYQGELAKQKGKSGLVGSLLQGAGNIYGGYKAGATG